MRRTEGLMPADTARPTSHVLQAGDPVRLRIDGVETPGEVVAARPSGWIAARTVDGRVWLEVNTIISSFGFTRLVLLERTAALSDPQALDRIATAIASHPTRADCTDVKGAAELRPGRDRLLDPARDRAGRLASARGGREVMRIGLILAAALAVGAIGAAAKARGAAAESASPPTPPQERRMELAGPFHARSAWRLVVAEGAPSKDFAFNDAPGALALCLHKGPAGPCVSNPVTLPLQQAAPDDSPAWEPHYLIAAKLVHPRGFGGSPLLLIVTGSLHSGDGDQIVATQLIAYDAGKDVFRRVYGGRTGRNNNQETRFLDGGPLRGSVVSAEPQGRAPYGYWITVSSPAAEGDYRPVLRYRSATLYNDGNPLAVIDSEAPNIERRLGLWKAGRPIPTDLDGRAKPCDRPVLRRTELWCNGAKP